MKYDGIIQIKTIIRQNNGLREDQVIVGATSQFSIFAELWDSLHPSAPQFDQNSYHVFLSFSHTLFSDSPVPACRASRLKSMILWWTCRSGYQERCSRGTSPDTQTLRDDLRSSRPWSPASPAAQARARKNPKESEKNQWKRDIYGYLMFPMANPIDAYCSLRAGHHFCCFCCFLCCLPRRLLRSLSRIELGALGPQRSDQNHHFCSVPAIRASEELHGLFNWFKAA